MVKNRSSGGRSSGGFSPNPGKRGYKDGVPFSGGFGTMNTGGKTGYRGYFGPENDNGERYLFAVPKSGSMKGKSYDIGYVKDGQFHAANFFPSKTNWDKIGQELLDSRQ